jgi:hypothetical protein
MRARAVAEAAEPCGVGAIGATLPLVKRKRRSRAMEFFAGLDVSMSRYRLGRGGRRVSASTNACVP